MWADLLLNPFVVALAGFLLGWLLASVSQHINAKTVTRDRDPRDARIRALEAELSVARKDADGLKSDLARLDKELKEITPGIESRDNRIAEQQASIEQLRSDLKGSVKKTRELRAELADRATENVHAEAKIREVETELSIVQASTDMIGTGVLDYADDDEDTLASESRAGSY